MDSEDNRYDQNEDDTYDDDDEQDDDDTLRILPQLMDSWSSATPKQPHQAHHDTLILSVAHLLPSTDARPLYFKRQEIRAE